MARYDLQPNDRIGDLRIISALGRGGQALTYIALADAQSLLFEPHTKIVLKAVPSQQNTVVIFDELRHLKHLQRQTLHPHVLHIYDWADGKIHPTVRAGMPNEANNSKAAADINNLGVRCIAFEYLPGNSLADRLQLQAGKRLTLPMAAKIGRELLHALSFIHQNGVMHLDIKPEHVLFRKQPKPRWQWWADAEEEAVLIDFGIARSTKDQMVLAAGQGTEQYASPEQYAEAYASNNAMRASQVSSASDVFTWGVLMYECLTGRNPHADANGQFSQALLNDPNFTPPSPSQLNPKVPKIIDDVLKRALKHDVKSRYQTGYEVLPEWEAAINKIRQPISTGVLRLLGASMISLVLLFSCVMTGFSVYLYQGGNVPLWLNSVWPILTPTVLPTATATPRPSPSPTRVPNTPTPTPTLTAIPVRATSTPAPVSP